MLISYGVLVTISLSVFLPIASSVSPSEEANALLKWKDSLQSRNHSILPSWSLPVARGDVNSSSHCSDWIGISCNKAGRVIDISLSNTSLIGTLVSFPFSSLPHLSALDLSSNQLFGTVPPHIANLTKLDYMDLSDNQFVGKLPSEIGQLASLQYLYLNGNNVNGSIPLDLCNLTNLIFLQLYANQLSGTLPSEITNLKYLQVLRIQINQFVGPIPLEIGNLRSLLDLDFSANNLNGSLPVEIGNLSSLVTLDLSHNTLTGSIPSSIGKLTKLEILYIFNNSLSGSIPSDIGNLKSLHLLYVRKNNLNGSIPSKLENLKSLMVLDMSLNSLSGSLPSFSGFHNLSVLALMLNQLSGVIPQEISKLKMLTHVTLDKNNFSGTLPDFCSGGLLRIFSASHNNFTGSIPKSMKNCPSLVRVRLDRNQLSGNMSEVFGSYPRLVYLDLSFNKLYGEISGSWRECKNLTNFKLSTNNITGRIPHGLGGLSQLGHLDISSNHLRGEVPSDLGKLSSLLHLNLSLNQLSGHLPRKIGGLNHLKILDLSANDLSGPIPKEIGDCSWLLYLDLSTNNFSGKIPSHIGNLAHLQVLLDLSQNMFSQEIPPELGKLQNLEKLNLSHNMLSGPIPSSLENMGSLMFVDLSYNALEGPVPGNQAFRDASLENLGNNTGLCGRVKALHPCVLPEISNGRGGGPRWIVQILVPSLIGLFLLAFMVSCFAFYTKRRESMKESRNIGNGDLFDIWNYDGKIVYVDIIEATEGFDSKYCIGVGGTGSVYKAEMSTGQVVAIKKFHQLIENDVDNLKSFDREVRVLLQLRHRNIVKLYGFCSHVLHSFLVYEYLERGSLAEILRNVEEAASLDWTKRINLIKSIAKALCYMHHGCAHPIIHRDISSKNILLNSKYDAFVSDFGIARVLQQNSLNWTSVAGTYGYLAPELAYTFKLTEKCDVFSFGVLTLEVLMGSHPGEFVSVAADTTSTPSRIDMLMVNMLDKRLVPPASSIYKELLRISELGFACLNASPESRPTFEFISNELSAYNETKHGLA